MEIKKVLLLLTLFFIQISCRSSREIIITDLPGYSSHNKEASCYLSGRTSDMGYLGENRWLYFQITNYKGYSAQEIAQSVKRFMGKKVMRKYYLKEVKVHFF